MNFLVQIETNGTIFRKLPKKVKIICSPKVTRGKYHKIRSDLLNRINAFKFIISENNKNYFDLPDLSWIDKSIPIYLQPMDEINISLNKKNLKRALEICNQTGYILSLQTHKILGLR
jgi:organic radical activating enzyme